MKIPILTNIFQMGWFNHQLVICFIGSVAFPDLILTLIPRFIGHNQGWPCSQCLCCVPPAGAPVRKGSINSHDFHIIGDKLINQNSRGLEGPIIRIPIKGWMTIPNTRSLDPGSDGVK